MTHAPNLLAPSPTVPYVLAIAPGRREAALAVARPDHLVRWRTVNLRKVRSREARESRFRNAVETVLDDFVIARLVIVRVPKQEDVDGLLGAEDTWLAEEAQRRSVPAVSLDAENIRARSVSPGKHGPTNRLLAEAMLDRFPELRRADPARTHPGAEHLGGAPESVVRTRRERYYVRLILAVAATQIVLEDLTTETVKP